MICAMRPNMYANARSVSLHLLLVLACTLGCGRNPNAGGYWGAPYATQYPGAPAIPGAGMPAFPPAQVTELERRIQQLDMDNRQLTTQLAQSQQKWQVLDERANLFQRQLADATTQLQQARLAQQDLQGQARGLQASMAMRGGATLRPNTSGQPASLPGLAPPAGGLGQPASAPMNPAAASNLQIANLQVPGAAVQMEGNVVRIRVPADQLFTPGAVQLNPASYQVIDNVANAIFRNFPRQRIAIEAHTDSGSAAGGASSNPYQLATAQAQAVMEQLLRRNTLPAQQLAIVGHGANFPRADNQSPAGRAENRRIEFVVYPETF